MFLSYLQSNYPDLYNTAGFKRPDILEGPIDFVIAESILIAILGEVTNHSSWVDKLWTFIPTLTTGARRPA